MTKLNSAHCLLVLASLFLNACATDQPLIPTPLDLPEKVAEYSALNRDNEQAREQVTRISETPKPPEPERLQAGVPVTTPAPLSTEEKPDITLSFEQIPLSSFIQVVYAEILKKNVNIDPQIVARKDLVTLRTGELQTRTQVESTARLLLKSFGIAVMDIGGLVRVVPDNTALGYLPEIRRGRALPETPLSLRPIFQLVELQAVRISLLKSGSMFTPTRWFGCAILPIRTTNPGPSNPFRTKPLKLIRLLELPGNKPMLFAIGEQN